VNLSPQVIVNCDTQSNGCEGGSPLTAYQYMHETGVTVEQCAPYQAVNLACTPENICKNCAMDLANPTAKCFAQTEHKVYKASEYGPVSGEEKMMAELTRGPISCGVSVTTAFVNYNGTGVFRDANAPGSIDHEISLAGWGEKDGVK
jgi:hypothetical protein